MSELSRIEQLAATNAKPPRNPCEVWDAMVQARRQHDGCDREVAVDRCLSTPGGSSAWQACCSWDAQQRRIRLTLKVQ